jgi:hypothetical protein
MKKICLIGLLAGVCGLAQATSITNNIGTLEGDDAYAWTIGVSATPSTITSASITFNNITLTAANSSGTGVLYVDLLNNITKTAGTVGYADGDQAGDLFSNTSKNPKYTNPFLNKGVTSLITTNFAKVGTTLSWTFNLTAPELAILTTQYLTDGYFAIGLDPDCHYTVGNIIFTYNTSKPSGTPTPDVATTALLFGVSLLGLEVLRRRFKLATAK